MKKLAPIIAAMFFLLLVPTQSVAKAKPPHAAWALQRMGLLLICPDTHSGPPLADWRTCFVDNL
jgi:hypothetical protein